MGHGEPVSKQGATAAGRNGPGDTSRTRRAHSPLRYQRELAVVISLHRCGKLQIHPIAIDVVWSVCVSVCLFFTAVNRLKRLSQSTCRLEMDLGGTNEVCISCWVRSLEGKGQIWGHLQAISVQNYLFECPS